VTLPVDALQVTSDSHCDWHRVIVSLRKSLDLFDDLVDNAEEHAILVEHEMQTKPFRGAPPAIARPFEESDIYDPIAAAIAWPFDHPCRSRYSNGSFGVWYGADSLVTAVHETAFHFRHNTMASAAVKAGSTVVQERRAHLVGCTAALIDLRPHVKTFPALLDPADYSTCQLLGSQIRAASLPGVLNQSVRYRKGHVVGVFRPEALTDPRTHCYLTYKLDVDSGRVSVEREKGDLYAHIMPT
jgi:hypothetical protein